jgi:hypothetical protein
VSKRLREFSGDELRFQVRLSGFWRDRTTRLEYAAWLGRRGRLRDRAAQIFMADARMASAVTRLSGLARLTNLGRPHYSGPYQWKLTLTPTVLAVIDPSRLMGRSFRGRPGEHFYKSRIELETDLAQAFVGLV